MSRETAKAQLKGFIRDVCSTVSLPVSFALKCFFKIANCSKENLTEMFNIIFLDSQPTHATYHEIPQSKASFLIGFLSVGSLAGRLLFGHVSDYRCVNRMYLYQSAFLIMAVTTTLCPLATNYGGLVLFTILFGIFDGVVVTLTPVITGDIVGSNKLSSALGFLYLVFSIPLMTGSLIAGTFLL